MIIAFSGKKQSGKNTAGNFIMSVFMANLDIAKSIQLNDFGQIEVSDLLGNSCYKGIFDPTNINTQDFILKQVCSRLFPQVQLYSFADILKKEVCINILGLTHEQCYGDDEAKNSLTEIEWSNMPGYGLYGHLSKNRGKMTARQVMEFVGTDIFRHIKHDVWVEATLKKIKQEKSKLAIITDCRFPNEVAAVKENNGKVIRLTRDPFNSTAKAEIALDSKYYDWSNFDYIIDNNNMSIFDQCVEIEKLLREVISL